MIDSPLGNIGLVAVTLYVADLDAALTWYAEKFGMQPMNEGSDGHRFAAFSFGGSIVVLEPIEAALEPAVPGSENTTLNVVVDRDPADVRADLLSRGVACGDLVTSNFVSFLVRDLDGNRFYVTRPVNEKTQRAVEETSAHR
ncbi:MAG: Glyoxalase/Bleomycin resistance protein/Dioxygenase superfamily [Actinomycetota bacterium]